MMVPKGETFLYSFINPQKETFPTGIPIGQKDREAFRKKKEGVLAWSEEDASF
jgi:hypothetical protein